MIPAQTQLTPNAVRNLKDKWSSTPAGLSPRPVNTCLPHSLKGWTICLKPQQWPGLDRSPRLELLAEPQLHLHPASSTESKAPHTAAIYRAGGSHHPCSPPHLGDEAWGDFWGVTASQSHRDPPAEDRPQHFYSLLLRLHKSVWTHQHISLRAHRKASSAERNFFFFPLVWSGFSSSRQ